jgi:predicted unusual protein kinase regulating ubiquinone biosynthesis (AarF/ABC1/UbiB family)
VARLPSSSETSRQLRNLDALIAVGLRLARSAPTGRIGLARIADTIDPLWIPSPWGDEILAELAAAQNSARDPLDVRGVERILRDAWGSRPTTELDELDPEPVAVTPAAQVHRGQLGGSPVAVKLLRPGLASAVRQDMALLDGLIAPLAAAFPAIDPRAVLAEVRARLLEELDLESEAEAQRRFHRALRRHPFLSVPAPITRLSTEAVLVSEWVDGTPIRSAADPDQAAARLALFVLGAARSGALHVDPHPDDVLVLADGGLAILDFGLTRTVQADRVDRAAAALDAFVANDPAEFGSAAEALGWLPADHGEAALELATYALGELSGPGPVRLDSAAVVRARDRLFERPDAIARLLLAGALPPPDLWPARGIAQLFGTIARVGADADWIEIARSAVRDGWEAAI